MGFPPEKTWILGAGPQRDPGGTIPVPFARPRPRIQALSCPFIGGVFRSGGMSDLSLQLQQAQSQLPVSSYFDEALFARETERLFARGPRYVGHALSVPELGDYY